MSVWTKKSFKGLKKDSNKLLPLNPPISTENGKQKNILMIKSDK